MNVAVGRDEFPGGFVPNLVLRIHLPEGGPSAPTGGLEPWSFGASFVKPRYQGWKGGDASTVGPHSLAHGERGRIDAVGANAYL